MILISAFSTILVLVYGLLVLWLRGCLRAGEDLPENRASFSDFVTVLVPFRNEAANLAGLLKDLEQQEFPRERFEVILIDDYSTDDSVQLIRGFAGRSALDLKLLENTGPGGKKAALQKGREHSHGTVILQTDADCRLPRQWLQQMTSVFKKEVVLALGPVVMKPRKGFWLRFAALEFMSLQAAGAAFTKAGRSFMGSAANMAYRPSLLAGAGQKRASGDDVFLIQKASRKGKVYFTMEKEAATATAAPESFREFISQRARWGGKTPAYASGTAIFTAALVAGLAGWQVFLLVFSFFHPPAIGWFVGVLLVKGTADYLLLSLFAKATGQNPLMRLFPLACLVYPFYILITGAVILFGSVSWKGRSFRPIVD